MKPRMTKNEILAVLAEAVENLRGARAGMGSTNERYDRRVKAGELLESLPANWWRKLGDHPLIDELRKLA